MPDDGDPHFVIDGSGISHVKRDVEVTYCGHYIAGHWLADVDPPLVCGQCVIKWMNS